jgi:trimeric autotransporter adhesin
MKRKQLRFISFYLPIGLILLLTLALASCTLKTTTSTTHAPTLSSIAVTPNPPANLTVGSTTQFTAIGSYSDGSTVDITSGVSWSSNNTEVATINSSGLATGYMAGSSNIMAAMSGVTSPTVTLTVMLSFGPTSFNIGTSSGNYTIPSVNAGDTVEFQFTVAGASVYYSVLDPNNNIILTGNGGNKVMSWSGSFIASTPGTYRINFKSSGILTPSVITVNGDIH